MPHHSIRSWVVGATAMGAALAAAPCQAVQSPEVEYSIPSQELGQSLRAVAIRSGTSIIAPSELVEGRRAPALNGRLAAQEAVRRLLQGTGLEVRQVGDALVVVRLDTEEEPPTIVVTGSNLRRGQQTSPVIIVPKSEIDASGANSVEQLMSKLPQNAQSGVNRENFRSAGAGADPTEHGAGLNLRGLGQRATLVLINGRRFAPSNAGSFVDVSLIPLSAIDRVEVLTDGASAIYGSDAVGGVVNFILRPDFKGVEALGLAGSATSGDGDVRQGALTAGTAWQGGRAMLSYEYRAGDSIDAGDRDFTINLAPDTSLLPDERRHSILANVGQQLASGLTADIHASYARRDTRRSYFFSGSPVPVGLDAEASMLGAGGTLTYDIGGSWQIRAGGGFSRTRTHQLQDELGGQGIVNARKTLNRLIDAGLKIDGSLMDLPAGPVRIAFGIERRRESFEDLFRTKFINSPTEARRDVWAVYFEGQVPIFSAANRRPGLEQLLISAAGRFERYDGFGSTFNPKVGLLWSPLEGLALKGSYSTSFRAPLLSETTGIYSAIYVPTSLVFVQGTPPAGVALALGGSNPDVGPERSRNFTAGVEWLPPDTPGLRLALNYYNIRFSDRIALPSQTVAVVGDPVFDSIVTHDPDDAAVAQLVDGAQIRFDNSGPDFSNGNAMPADVIVVIDGRTTNMAKTVTNGLDASLAYQFQWQGSEFRLDANLNYIFSFKDQLRPSSPIFSVLDTPFRPLDLRFRAHAGWSRGPWSANLFLNHAGGYRDNRGNRSQSVDSWTTLDAGVAYSVGRGQAGWLKGLRLALNAENLLDQEPPGLLPDPGSTAGVGYDPANASGRGRFVSLSLRKSW